MSLEEIVSIYSKLPSFEADLIKSIKREIFDDRFYNVFYNDIKISNIRFHQNGAVIFPRNSLIFTAEHNNHFFDYVSIYLYIAATYEGYTLDTILEHKKELAERSFQYYIRTISFFNKNIPDDLKLWLELYI